MAKKYTKWPQNIPNGRKIDQMVIKYTNFSHCKTLQNLHKLGFWFENLPSGIPGFHGEVINVSFSPKKWVGQHPGRFFATSS
jgi:hypothetical protein